MVEQDNAPSSTDLAQSLKHARIGYDNLAALRK